MNKMIWNTDMSVGLKQFDDEHREMMDLLNDIHSAISEKESDVVITGVFKKFIECGVTHFSHEEELMDEFGYPDAEAHKKEHDDLVSKVNNIYEQYENGKKAYSLELVLFLKDWMLLHLKVTDTKYTSFFIGKGVK
jgi:hemerythrin-like metal-binding protein